MENIEMVLALKGPNFTMVACDTTLGNSQLFLMKNDLIKYHQLQDSFLLLTTGSYSDIRVLINIIKAEMELHRLTLGREFTHHELVRKIRLILAEHFSRDPLQVIATYVNEDEGPQINVIKAREDIASFDIVGQGVMGTAACESCLRPVYRPNLTEDQAYIILEEIMRTLMTRMPMNYPTVKVAVVRKTGITTRPDIRTGSMG